jgi:hypothetical protein
MKLIDALPFIHAAADPAQIFAPLTATGNLYRISTLLDTCCQNVAVQRSGKLDARHASPGSNPVSTPVRRCAGYAIWNDVIA